MIFGMFGKKNDIVNAIQNKDIDEVTSSLGRIV